MGRFMAVLWALLETVFSLYKQGRNKVYGIRDQQQKMGWDQGSQRRDLGSQAVGSGSALPQGDQGFPHNNKDQKIMKCTLLIGVTCQHFSI